MRRSIYPLCAKVLLVSLLLTSGGISRATALPPDSPQPTQLQTVRTGSSAFEHADLKPFLKTTWMGFHREGKRIGYLRGTLDFVQDQKRTSYRYTLEVRTKLLQGNQPTEQHSLRILEFDGVAPFLLRGASQRRVETESSWEVKLERKEQGFEVVVAESGETHRFSIALGDYTLLDLLSDGLWLRQSPRPGDKLTTRYLDLDSLGVSPLTLSLLGVNTVATGSKPGDFLEVQWGDSVLRYARDTRELAVIRYRNGSEYLAESEAQARDIEPWDPHEASAQRWKIDRPLGDLRRLGGLTVALIGYRGAGLHSGACQLVSRDAAGTWVCKLGKKNGISVLATAEDIKANLRETPRHPISHPKVQELMQEAVGDATSTREKAERLVHYVHRLIRYESNRTPRLFKLLQTRRGNCQSYALLFATLARAAGIPAREVSGLVYAGDHEQRFDGHQWNEIVLEGCWVPVDPTWNRTELGPLHIKMDNLDEGMSIKVLEVERVPASAPNKVAAVTHWFADRPWACLVLLVIVFGVGYWVGTRNPHSPIQGAPSTPPGAGIVKSEPAVDEGAEKARAEPSGNMTTPAPTVGAGGTETERCPFCNHAHEPGTLFCQQCKSDLSPKGTTADTDNTEPIPTVQPPSPFSEANHTEVVRREGPSSNPPSDSGAG